MKKIFGLFALVLFLCSCAVKVPFTNEVKEEFGLDSEEKMRKVQFFTSSTINFKTKWDNLRVRIQLTIQVFWYQAPRIK